MKKVGKTTGLAFLLIVLAGITQLSHPSPGVTHAFDFELEPISQLKKDAPITVKLTFSPRYQWCKKVSITLSTLNYVEKFSERSWDVELQDDQPYSTAFQVSIPDDDTSAVYVTLGCRWLQETIKRFFVTTGDTVKYWKGDPRDYHPSPPPSKTNDPIRDTLTMEQLQTKYEVWLDLRDPTHLEIAESILGPLPDSSKCEGYDGYYILSISMDKILKLGEQGIELDELHDKERQWIRDRLRKQRPESDSTDLQGNLEGMNEPALLAGFSLEYVDGLTPEGKLAVNQTFSP